MNTIKKESMHFYLTSFLLKWRAQPCCNLWMVAENRCSWRQCLMPFCVFHQAVIIIFPSYFANSSDDAFCVVWVQSSLQKGVDYLRFNSLLTIAIDDFFRQRKTCRFTPISPFIQENQFDKSVQGTIIVIIIIIM